MLLKIAASDASTGQRSKIAASDADTEQRPIKASSVWITIILTDTCQKQHTGGKVILAHDFGGFSV